MAIKVKVKRKGGKKKGRKSRGSLSGHELSNIVNIVFEKGKVNKRISRQPTQRQEDLTYKYLLAHNRPTQASNTFLSMVQPPTASIQETQGQYLRDIQKSLVGLSTELRNQRPDMRPRPPALPEIGGGISLSNPSVEVPESVGPSLDENASYISREPTEYSYDQRDAFQQQLDDNILQQQFDDEREALIAKAHHESEQEFLRNLESEKEYFPPTPPKETPPKEHREIPDIQMAPTPPKETPPKEGRSLRLASPYIQEQFRKMKAKQKKEADEMVKDESIFL